MRAMHASVCMRAYYIKHHKLQLMVVKVEPACLGTGTGGTGPGAGTGAWDRGPGLRLRLAWDWPATWAACLPGAWSSGGRRDTGPPRAGAWGVYDICRDHV